MSDLEPVLADVEGDLIGTSCRYERIDSPTSSVVAFEDTVIEGQSRRGHERVEGIIGTVEEAFVVTRADAEHEDPAIGAFLSLLARDIEAGRNVQGLPEDLARAMLEHAGHNLSLDEEIVGDVAL